MAIREYIGARYVPIFGRIGEESAEWDNSKPYEPLTIVTYQGNSFTSRQYVPAGIDINNTEFWVSTGIYNAQVEQYRQEVMQFNARINKNADDIKTLNGDLDTFEETTNDAIEDINARINKNADDINEDLNIFKNTVNSNGWVTTSRISDRAVTRDKLANSIHPYSYFNNYNAVFIGDSYTYGTGASDHLDGDTKRFSSILASKLYMTEFNFGVGSTGFCDPGSSGQNAPFKTQVLNAANSMTDEQKNNTHLVVIAGGVNDFNEGAAYGAADMRNGAHDAVSNAINNFPNAIVLLVPMLFKGHSASARLFNFENSLIQGITSYAGTRRAKYIQGAWTWNYGLASHYTSDKLHPNDTGHMLIANMIYSHILGGDAYVNSLVGLTYESGFSSNVDMGGYYQFFNGLMTCQGIQLAHPKLTANEVTKFASLGGGFAPLQNATGVFTYGNAQKGIWIITNSGNCYIVPSEDLAAGNCYLAPINYLPSGSY